MRLELYDCRTGSATRTGDGRLRAYNPRLCIPCWRLLKANLAHGGVVLAAIVYIVVMAATGLAPHGAAPLAAVFVAASVASLAGFAFSPICGALLFHQLDTPLAVVEIMLLCSVANQTLSVIALWHSIVWRLLLPFVVAGVLGAPLGVILLLRCDPRVYLVMFGSVLVVYGLYQFLRRTAAPRRPAAHARIGDIAAGFAGGVGSGFAGLAGMPVAIWLNMQGWDKLRQRALFQPFILLMQVLSLLLMFAMKGNWSVPAMHQPGHLAYLPVSLLGTWCGLQVFRGMTDRQFTMVINLLLIISGLGMIV
ncbi:MAG: sulfite exporter TauE/SafE family protein [Acetobacteraceae bacterium]